MATALNNMQDSFTNLIFLDAISRDVIASQQVILQFKLWNNNYEDNK